MKTISKE
jgi:hypothetical protein